MSKNSLVFGLLILALLTSSASAQNCSTIPNTLANATVADATKVMGNFTYLGGCTASIASPSLTGSVSISAPSTSTSGTFVGLNLSGAQSVGSTGNYYGIESGSTFTATSGTISSFYGTYDLPANTGGGTIGNMIGVYSAPQNSGSGSVTYMKGMYAGPSHTGSGSVGYMYGIEAQPLLNGAGNMTTLMGVQSLPTVGSSATAGATISQMYGVASTPQVGGAVTITKLYGVSGLPEVQAAASVTYMYALYGDCQNQNTGGSVSNCYELYLDTPTLTGPITNIYGIYQTYSSAVNYLAGKLGIGTNTPAQALEVNGEVKVDTLAAATSTNVCINANVLASCSSSLRYKENVKDAPFGLDEVMKMRPVTFKWKGRDEEDFGLIAEDVAKIDPLFATYRDGKIEGVKYGQLTAVLVGAVKQLKTANDAQAQEIVRLRNEVDQLQKEQETQSADRQELSTLKSENALLKARLDGIDARLDGLETRRHMHSASRSERMLHLASSRGG